MAKWVSVNERLPNKDNNVYVVLADSQNKKNLLWLALWKKTNYEDEELTNEYKFHQLQAYSNYGMKPQFKITHWLDELELPE